MTVEVRLKLSDVDNVNDLLCYCSLAKRSVWRRFKVRLALTSLNICGWRIARRSNRAVGISFAKIQSTDPGVANAHSIFQHNLKDWLKLAG